MPRLPFWMRYPYTNFEQLNLDNLLNEVGSYSKRIEDLEQLGVNHENRITALETTVGNLDERLDSAEDDINDLKGRMNTAESSINNINVTLGNLDERLDDAEDKINDIKAKDDRQDAALSAIDSRLDTIEDDITDLGGLASQVQRNTNDIMGIDSRVDSLEDAKVIANPGGTPGRDLTTIRIGSTDYAIPSGGGGGGGTSVTPNPAGTPTDTLNTVDIAGTIYDVPSGVDTSDMIAEEYEPAQSYVPGDVRIHDNYLYKCIAPTSGAWDSTKWARTTCASIAGDADQTAKSVEALYQNLGAFFEDTQSGELDTSSSTRDYLPGTRRTLTPGSWIVTFNATFDTHTLGSKQRGLYTYIDVDGTIVAQGGKYMWGSEAITDIAYANSVSIMALVDVPAESTKVVTPYVRVPVNTGSGEYTVDVRIGYICVKPR